MLLFNYLYNKLNILGTKEELDINHGFISRLKHRIYRWYVDSDFYFLNLCFIEDLLENI